MATNNIKTILAAYRANAYLGPCWIGGRGSVVATVRTRTRGKLAIIAHRGVYFVAPYKSTGYYSEAVNTEIGAVS